MATVPLVPVRELERKGLSAEVIQFLELLRALVLNLTQGSGFVFSNGSRAMVSDATGALAESVTTAAELLFVNGVTSNIQAQLNGKLSTSGGSVGDGTNQAVFESDGTLRFDGTATTFDDLPPVPIISLKPSGAGADPALVAFVGNIEQYTFGIGDYINGSVEITHGYKEGSDIDIHLHWATNGSEVGDKAVNWEVEWTVANMGPTYPDAFTANTPATSGDVTIPGGTADRAGAITSIGTIDGTGLTIGAYICFRLRRIALTGAGTNPAADPFGIAVGFHVEQDTIGSRTTYTK